MSVYKNLYVRETLEAKTSNISNDLTVSQNASISGSLNIGGDLVVSGTTTTIDTTNLNVVDKYVYLNSGYTADAAVKSGLVVNYDPSTVTSSVATGGFTTTTVHVTDASGFAANDIIQINGANKSENTGIFVIDGAPDTVSTPNVITIKTTGVDFFAHNTFVVDTTVAGSVYKVAVSILRTTTAGDWEIVKGDNDASLTTVGVATTSGGGNVSFNTVTAEAASNQLVLGVTNTATITSTQSAASTFTIPDVTGNDTFVMLGATQTLTNKTLTAPVISSIVNTGTLTLPTDTTTLVGIDTTDTLTNKTLTTPVISSIVNTGTLTLPTSTDTLVGRDTTDTLTNKTLTTPVISSIVNTGTLTLPTDTTTLVGIDTTDTLTNKTLTAPVISSIVNTGTLTLPTSTDTLVGRDTTDTLTNKTLTAPVISSPEISLAVVAHANTSPVTVTGAINTFTPAGASIANLPDATAVPGKTYKFILSTGAGSVAITPAIGQSIEGVVNGTHVLDAPQQHCSVTSDGVSWYINL
jgi:hypothetical protein